jgi:CSLREA domain-containing protein
MKTVRNLQIFFTFLLVLALLAPWQAAPARAEKALVFTVNTTADTHAANPAASVCADSSGNCSLRAALETATLKDGVEIYLPSGTYDLTLGMVALIGTDALTQISLTQTGGGTLPIITGVTTNNTFQIDGNLGLSVSNVIFSATRNIYVGELGTLSMLNVTLSGMYSPSSSPTGGAVIVKGKAYFTGCTFSGNSASNAVNGLGGAIYNQQGYVEIVASTFSDNTADYGGAIYSQMAYDTEANRMSIKTSSFTNNTATIMGGAIHLNGYNRQFSNGHSQVQIEESRVIGNSAPDGGGIFIGSSFPTTDARDQGGVNILLSEISDNIATSGNGGGIYIKNVLNTDNEYLVNLENTTISGNEAYDQGGGIYVAQDGGSAIYGYNVTITDNAADRTGVNSGINAGNGGGYASADTTSVLHLSNSILADNRDLSGGTIPIRIPDCVGKLSLSYSLLGLHQIAKCTLVGDTGTSIIGSSTTIDPGLNSLNDLGQFTRVHSLLISSPAINAGDPAGCSGVGPRLLMIDQHYNDRVRGGICDLGAYESRYSKIFLPAIQK